MRVSRSLATLVATASLGGSAFLLTAPAQAATTGPDVTGTVTAGGAPAADVAVRAYDVNADGTFTDIDDVVTNTAGQYTMDFKTDPGATPSTTPTIVLRYEDGRDETRGQLDWRTQFTGNEPTLRTATPFALVATGPVIQNIALPVLGGVQGSVSVPVPAGYTYDGEVLAYDSDDQIVDIAGFDNDPTNDTSDPLDGLTSFEFRDLLPGTYHFLFTAAATPTDPSSTAPDIDYIGSFYGNSNDIAGAKAVTVKSGAFTGNINGSLSNVLQATTAPSIKGVAAPGHRVKADPGTWSQTFDNTYSYQWLVNGKLKSTASSYKVRKHDFGKKLQLIVTNQIGNNFGTVASKKVRVGLDSKYKAKAHAVYVHGRRVVQVFGYDIPKKLGKKTSKPGGHVTVYEVRDGKPSSPDAKFVKVGKGQVAKNGSFVVTVKGATAGRHVYEVVYSGTKKIAGRTSFRHVRV